MPLLKGKSNIGTNIKTEEAAGKPHRQALAIALSTAYGKRGRKENKMAGKHPGFKAVQSSIEKKEGLSHKAAGAILAASSRRASAGAKKANPRLNRVKG